jgi:nucleoside-diphosphate-sugar epimerase
MRDNTIIQKDDLVLITGSNGFIGARVVESLLGLGFTRLRCFVRPASNLKNLKAVLQAYPQASVEVVPGNLLSKEDCARAARDVFVVYHLAASSEKTFPGCFMNCVVTTRNLLEALVQWGRLRRFVNIGSFAVYSNWNIYPGGPLDETCELEPRPVERAEAYVYAKLKQDQLVMDYAKSHRVPYVIVRPGAVYGPGTRNLTGRVGIDTFGLFFHLGGSNQIPLTYVDNCAQAIVLAGIKLGVEGEVFNVVDDDLPSSRKFLGMYKRQARYFRSIYIPYSVFYIVCWMWENYSAWSNGQLPPSFNRRRCAAYWKGNRYNNRKLKDRLGWSPAVPFAEAAKRYFQYVRETAQ